MLLALNHITQRQCYQKRFRNRVPWINNCCGYAKRNHYAGESSTHLKHCIVFNSYHNLFCEKYITSSQTVLMFNCFKRFLAITEWNFVTFSIIFMLQKVKQQQCFYLFISNPIPILLRLIHTEHSWTRKRKWNTSNQFLGLAYMYHQRHRFFVPVKNGFNVVRWYCLHIMLKRSKVSMMKNADVDAMRKLSFSSIATIFEFLSCEQSLVTNVSIRCRRRSRIHGTYRIGV